MTPFLIHQLSLPASSSESLPTLFPTGHEKSVSSHAIFKSQAPMKFPVPTTVVTVLKTCPETLSFMENHQKSEKPPISTLKTLELAVLTPFNWADNARALLLSPTPMRPHASIPQPHTHSCCYASMDTQNLDGTLSVAIMMDILTHTTLQAGITHHTGICQFHLRSRSPVV